MSEERSELSKSVRGIHEKNTFSPDIPSWALVFGSLLISWAVIHYYQIEEQLGLVQLFPFVIVGFTLNSWMPRDWRLWFQVIITITASAYLYGVINTAFLVGFSIGILTLVHSGLTRRIKLVLMLAIGVCLGLMKSGVLIPWVPSIMITVIAAVFMFRLAIYLYDLEHEKEHVSPIKRMSYFLMLPNLIFPIFPIIDYKVYKRTYYNVGDVIIYRRGIEMIMRGVLHLLIYRLIYLFFIPGVDQVLDLMSLLQYLVMSYLTIMRLSGMFHVVLGILLLFGFNLPEIFNNYFLANGFSDYWRRINIYWKDFMLKLFYYPFYFRIKHWDPLHSLVATTVVVFFFTWLLHVYQWFWVLGTVEFRATDLAFWGIFGVLVTISAVMQQKRKSGLKKNTFLSHLRTSLGISSTFLVASVMWSIWISPTFESWFSVLSVEDVGAVSAWVNVLSCIAIGVLALTLGHMLYFDKIKGSPIERAILGQNRHVLLALLIFALLSSTPQGQDIVMERFGFSMNSFMQMRLNEGDQTKQFENYYDEILTANNLTSPLWQQRSADNEDIDRMHQTELVQETDNILFHELRPNFSLSFKDKIVTTNSLGMRDMEYSVDPDSGVVRLAIVGGSIELGSGVSDDEVFEQIVERQLNSQIDSARIEIMNFSHSSRSLIQHLYNLENNVVEYSPDILLLFNHDREWNAMSNLFLKVARKKNGVDKMPYPELQEILDAMEFDGRPTKEEILRQVIPELESIYRYCYGTIAYLCRERKIRPIWVHLPGLVREGSVKIPYEKVESIARSAGFEIIDLSEVYADWDLEMLQVSAQDIHPNAEGHRLIAKALLPELERIMND